MKRLAIALVSAAALAAALAPTASASSEHPAHIGCYKGESWDYAPKPRSCDFNGGPGQPHYKQVNLRKMHWHKWGGKIACGTGEVVYNMGYRAPARFCAYKRVDDGGWWFYTRIRGSVGRGSYIGVDGRRVVEAPHPRRHFDTKTD